ncbi:MAG: pilus assembly protein PilM [Candidatus Omnitrophota bacterium]
MERKLNDILCGLFLKEGLEKLPWKKESHVLAIDVGTTAVKWVLLKRVQNSCLFLENGVDSPANLRAILEKSASYKNCRIRLAVSGPKVLLKRILLPKMPLSEVATALRWQIKEDIPFPMQEVYLHFQLVKTIEKEGKTLLDVLVGIVHREVVDSILALLDEANPFEIEAIVPAVSAVAQLLPPKRKKECALIDFGASAAHVGLFHEGILEVSREIPIGGEELTRALTCEIMVGPKKFSLNREAAERAKCAYGILQKTDAESEESEIPHEKLWILMRPTLERLVGELKRLFQYYENTCGCEIEEIWMTGGSSGLQGLGGLLERHLGLVPNSLFFVEQFNFSEDFFRDRTRAEMERRLAVAIASAFPRKSKINFLPPKVLSSRRDVLRKQITKVGIVSVILLALMLHTIFAIQKMALHRKLITQQQRWEKVASERRAHIYWMDERKRAESRIEFFTVFAKGEPLWEGVLKELSWLVPKEISIKTMWVTAERSPGDKRKRHNFRMQGIVAGSGKSAEETLAQFLEALEASPFFHQTALIATEGVISAAGEGVPFEATCELELEGVLEGN